MASAGTPYRLVPAHFTPGGRGGEKGTEGRRGRREGTEMEWKGIPAKSV